MLAQVNEWFWQRSYGTISMVIMKLRKATYWT